MILMISSTKRNGFVFAQEPIAPTCNMSSGTCYAEQTATRYVQFYGQCDIEASDCYHLVTMTSIANNYFGSQTPLSTPTATSTATEIVPTIATTNTPTPTQSPVTSNKRVVDNAQQWHILNAFIVVKMLVFIIISIPLSIFDKIYLFLRFMLSILLDVFFYFPATQDLDMDLFSISVNLFLFIALMSFENLIKSIQQSAK